MTVRRFFRPLHLCAVTVLVTSGIALAYVNEAISMALEAATPYVKEGFSVREDNWSGETEEGKPLLIRHQLFRGNEYWFWAGTSYEKQPVRVDVFDGSGKPVAIENFQRGYFAGARVLPDRTATYFVRVTVGDPKKQKKQTIDWSLVYGYR